MELNDKMIREISAILVALVFGILVFLAIKPFIFAVIWGLILAYIFMPVFNWINFRLNGKTISALIIVFLVALVTIVPIWFVVPIIVQQVFELFTYSQTLDLTSMIQNIFPTSSPQFTAQLSTTITSLIGKGTSSVMNSLISTFLDIPMLIVNMVIIGLVFFFTMRDYDKLKEFIKGISPLSKAKEKIVVKHFKDITYSTIYGRFVVGLVQGLLASLGFVIFGVNNALVLSALAIFLCLIPVVGVFLIWIPLAVYMLIMGQTGIAIAFVLYNGIIVSNIDNLLMAYLLSKRTNLSPLFALISSIGGLFLFGVIGIILGPLIFAYFIIILDLYREKNLLSLFATDEESKLETAPETK